MDIIVKDYKKYSYNKNTMGELIRTGKFESENYNGKFKVVTCYGDKYGDIIYISEFNNFNKEFIRRVYECKFNNDGIITDESIERLVKFELKSMYLSTKKGRAPKEINIMFYK